METHESIFTQSAAALAPDDLRREFLVTGMFRNGEARLRYWDTDRTVLGGIEPAGSALALPNPPELRSTHFLERREAGLVNLGGPGMVRVAATQYRVENLDALYLGRGLSEVSFESLSAAEPARFWLLSYPAHVEHPARHIAFKEARGEQLGDADSANRRTLYKLIHPGAFPTCQVVMGVTRLAAGSVWNTMPPHTHRLRSEVYLYFDVKPGQAVFHVMGRPFETRHLVVHDSEAVLSPPWSIHCGAGTSSYSFVWGMGGENQEFADMARAEIGRLR
jgi:4-deoxy-L-threo-5-hexosulose-uronate ketol-isomerase